MKKILLAVSALFLINAMFAQDVAVKRNMNTVAMKKTIMTGREEAIPQEAMPMLRSVSRNFIGTTFYDLQTNGSMAPKMIAHNDGTISTVWTTMASGSTSRGTGYNYYNGTSWINSSSSTDRIEPVRTGWGTLACIGDVEITASHNGTNALVIGVCPQKGTNEWTFTTLEGPAVSNGAQTSTCLLWPAMVATGNIVHLIACTESDPGYLYQGIHTCLVYYRGTFNASNNTITWENPRVVGDVTAAEVPEFSGDSYAIAAKGNTVAILNAPMWNDVFLWKSNDNGVNFTKTTIFQHPIPGCGESTTLVLDTPYVADGSCAVALDDNGNAHVAFGITRLLNDDISDGQYSYFPGVVGMLYWKEGMQPILNTDVFTLEPENIEAAGYKIFYRSDLNNDGGAYWSSGSVDFPGYGCGAVSMPQIIAENGNVYLFYAAILDWPFLDVNNDYDPKYYRGVFATKSTDNGDTWNGGVSWLSYNKDCYYIDDWSWVSDTNDVMVHAMENLYIDGESVFPAVAPHIVNGQINLHWQQDFYAGTYTKSDGTPFAESYIIYQTLDADAVGSYNNTDEVCQGLWIDYTGLSNRVISGMKMYPNPASESVNITFSSEESANAVISVMNLMGQTVYTDNININEGYNLVTLSTNNFRSGVYMVNIKTATGTSTQKLIVK